MENKWRLIYNPEGDAADLVAYPSGIFEGKYAGRFLGTAKRPPNTLLIQGLRKKGLVTGADVFVREGEAEKRDMDLVRMPRIGRGGSQPCGTILYQDLVIKQKKEIKPTAAEPESLALLMYTSGTTGRPKGAMLRSRGLVDHANGSRAVMKVDDKDRVLVVLPLFHAYGLNALSTSAILAGGSIVLIPQYDPVRLIETIAKTKATVFCAVPTIFIHLLQVAAKRSDLEVPPSIRFTMSAAAPLSVETIREFEKIFNTRISEGFGMTECTALASINPIGAGKPGSIGKPAGQVAPEACDVEMKIVDPEGREVPQGETGEILIRSRLWGMSGYYNRPDATAETIRDGWIYSGDMGWMDEDGYFFITDRKKDMLISGGFNVYPREIEEVLHSHPKVLEATVIGVPDPTRGEVPKAFVVPKEGEGIDPGEIVDFCQNNLAAYKAPRLVEVVDFLPKNLSGKVLKKELRDGYVDDRLITKEGEGKEKTESQ